MPTFRITVTVHEDYFIDVDADTKEEAIDMVNGAMGDYIGGRPADYSYNEIVDVETM